MFSGGMNTDWLAFLAPDQMKRTKGETNVNHFKHAHSPHAHTTHTLTIDAERSSSHHLTYHHLLECDQSQSDHSLLRETMDGSELHQRRFRRVFTMHAYKCKLLSDQAEDRWAGCLSGPLSLCQQENEMISLSKLPPSGFLSCDVVVTAETDSSSGSSVGWSPLNRELNDLRLHAVGSHCWDVVLHFNQLGPSCPP